ncbi:divalent-cation tolerance protein CutA [Coralloluteibacterium stylophorae]|uniref:Divalent-cation tolerance protein CutA n=1 Tax=Coralloluteibacterium stylophorae TaxID=1776034 RepID=A0A8J7VU52_9GAMM|nr:divalent-cation tolerance protein CutA [Coralloluteibacterium stylophorae]MBS7458481.1 divalent-cation tolerance protein CutA [Coralloluteibacterium stylophorae]
MTAFLVFCACPDADIAERIARDTVDARLAACASLVPGLRSVYRWQGAVEAADEVQLQIKTWGDRLDALTARIRELHPYELPEVLAVEAGRGLAGYLDWIRDETRSPREPAA